MAHPPLPMLLLLLVAVGVLGGVKAGVNPRCGCERTRHARRLEEDAKIPPYGMEDPVASWEVEELPQQFDWSSVAGKSYLVGSWNQHIPKYCGSCFAHGTLMSLNDRIKVAKDGKGPEIMLSRQSFINCGPEFGFSSGCMGGNPTDIFQFMHDIGLPDETCQNYVAQMDPICTSQSMCMNCMVVDDEGTKECWAVQDYVTYHVTGYGEVSGEAAIMSEVFARGPVVCGFISNDAFDFDYEGGVWRGVSEKQDLDDINHDVEITGWGVTEDGVKFWQARNSWGTYWGESGFFKIERGIDLNRIESMCLFALVDPISDEDAVRSGQLVGSMYGLMPKDKNRAKESIDFDAALSSIDWSAIKLPPVLSGMNPSSDVAPFMAQQEAQNVGGHAFFVGACVGAILGIAVAVYIARKHSPGRGGYVDISTAPMEAPGNH